MKFIRKHFFRLVLFVCLPVYILASIAAIFIAPFSVMAFDAPGSEKQILPWIFLGSVYGLALCFVLSDIGILLFSLKRKRKLLIYSLLFPVPFVVVLFLLFLLQSTF